jgi:hypothetical protein
MNLQKKWLFLSATLLIFMLHPMAGQAGHELRFQGLLADIEGVPIGEDIFQLNVLVHQINNREILYEFSSVKTTDKEGWFGFTIEDVTQYMMQENGTCKPVVLQLEFIPDTHTNWMEEGNDFLVTYTLEPSKTTGAVFQMTRMEGSALEVYSDAHLHAFRDHYPFAYLTGGFLLSDQPPIDSLSIADLRQWLTPDEEEDASRGVKGGFPVGGYRKKK